jgi:ribosomal protein L40E
MSESTSKSAQYKQSVDAMQDLAAHHKFMKQTGLRYSGEKPRFKYASGTEGWLEWRKQFSPPDGEARTLVENSLAELRDRQKLTAADITRLEKLYGVRVPAIAQAAVIKATKPEIKTPAAEMPQKPVPAPVKASPAPIKVAPPVKPAPPTPVISPPVAPAPAPVKISVTETAQKFCTNCGAKAAPGAKFCTGCGSVFADVKSVETEDKPKFCTRCGAKLADGAKFCNGCGKPA